jgi:hypothetical protein
MRKLLFVLAAGIMSIGVAGQSRAVSLDFDGSVTISLVGQQLTLPGGGVATVNGSNGAGHLTALTGGQGAFSREALTLVITPPAGGVIGGLQVTAANGAMNFGAGGGGNGAFGGVMPINGVTKVCLFGTCSGASANLNVPLTVVGGGDGRAPNATWVTGAVNLTVVGAPWTTGTASVGTITQMGGVAPASNTGAPSGNLTLVTPIFISTAISGSEVVPGFAFLNLHFVPEPGTLMLLGSGIAGLVAFGRSRVR